jgi:hypothetical protein
MQHPANSCWALVDTFPIKCKRVVSWIDFRALNGKGKHPRGVDNDDLTSAFEVRKAPSHLTGNKKADSGCSLLLGR